MNDYSIAAIGGTLIGAAAVILMSQLGRIMGVSGIVWRGISDTRLLGSINIPWQIYFILGIVLGSLLSQLLLGISIPSINDKPLFVVVIAGILVGFGTNFGSGCTSGHGVCGISRLSIRSIIATLIFMAFGVITVYITRHLLG